MSLRHREQLIVFVGRFFLCYRAAIDAIDFCLFLSLDTSSIYGCLLDYFFPKASNFKENCSIRS